MPRQLPLTCGSRWTRSRAMRGKQGRCGALGSRISAPRFARGKGDVAGPEISFGARSGRCAGFRDVVTRAWPVSSYFCEWIVRGLRGGLLVRLGQQDSGWIRIEEDSVLSSPSAGIKTTTGKQLRVQVKTVCELGRREEDCAAVL